MRTGASKIVAGAGIVALVAVGLAAQQAATLVLNGQATQASVVQVKGRSYVDVAGLARAMNGSVSYSNGQVALAVPGVSVAAAAPAGASNAPALANSAPANTNALSRGFLRAGIEAMSTVREWHTALATGIANGYPITADWLLPYQQQAATQMRLARTAAVTDGDKNTYQLMQQAFDKMQALAQKYIDKKKNLDFVAPDALKNDDMDQSLVACGHSLALLAGSGEFTDDGSCS